MADAKQIPNAITTHLRRTAEGYSVILHIVANDANELSNHASFTAASAGSTEVKGQEWKDLVDLSHLQDGDFRAKLVCMLAKHATMWNGMLGTVKTKKHQTDL